MISREELLKTFEYREGELIRLTNAAPNARIGDVASYIGKRGYYYVSMGNKRLLVHRLIYIMHYGHTDKELDHIDGNPLNNRIENLRLCTSSQNKCNSKIRCNNKSGIKGVYWNKATESWRGRIDFEGKTHEQGLFKTIFDAACKMIPARERIHGEFAKHS